jgi:thiamine pyrophosphokinase
MGVDKTPHIRLLNLPYHVDAYQVRDTGERFDQLINAIDWLYDYGPASRDWFIYEREDGFYISKERHVLKPNPTRRYTFAFRERKDAILFKLVWNKLISDD